MKEDFSSVRSLPQNHLNEVTLCPICFSDQIVVSSACRVKWFQIKAISKNYLLFCFLKMSALKKGLQRNTTLT